MKIHPLLFPKNFVWGVATAAPQIEGAAFEDGKGRSSWDEFCRQPGRVHNGDTLDVACDHYHRFADDFRLMRELGVKNYRLSLAWPRIHPDGAGPVNQKGLDFYHRLFDAMEANGITPWVTMFHWDTPYALEQQGGWRNRATAEAFGRYADTVVRAFGRRVKNWITLNELRCFTTYAYSHPFDRPPSLQVPDQVVNQTVHHALVAHGHGVRAVREHGARGSRVGISDNPELYAPLTETPEDIAAARAVFTERNDHILGAMTHGRYLPSVLRRWGKDRPVAARGDLDLIGTPTDFLGLNLYTGTLVRAPARRPRRGQPAYEKLPFPEGYPQTPPHNGWIKSTPTAIYWTLRFCAEAYRHDALYITENGYGAFEEPDANGEVLDLHRREYLRCHLHEARRAIADGTPLKGYFCWSFMDNFEWADGYRVRFGLVHTDYATQKRTPKLSARWYSQVMRENRIV
jgi:beta-glucosidase